MLRFRKGNTLLAILLGVLVLYMELDYRKSMKETQTVKVVR